MRLVISGVGVVSGLGVGVEATWRGVRAGERALRPVTLFDTSAQRCHLGAEVPGLDVASVAPAGRAHLWSRTDAMAWLAADEALRQARLAPSAERTALVVGGSTAGLFECEGELAALSRDASRCHLDEAFARQPLSATLERLFESLGPFDRTRMLCSACSAGSNALLLGAVWLSLGLAERVLVGAAEGLCRLTFAGFDALQATDPEGCRPFDRQRHGMNLGEGAAFLVLETDRSARARGASPLAELVGWACGTEATHITQPEESGRTVRSLIERALARAQASPDEVDFVSAHGTGTARNDPAESTALRDALAGAQRAWVSSHKGQLGHTLAAAGALGAALTTLALRDGAAPPTGGLSDPDPECSLRLVLGAAQPAPLRLALVNAFGFGGLDTVLALRHPDAAPDRELSPPAPSPVVVTAAFSIDPRGLHPLDDLAARVAAELSGSSGHESGALPAPPGGTIALAALPLDAERTRRLDRSARVTTVAFQEALRQAGLVPAPADARLGGVAGSAFGAVSACADHSARTEDARGRCANPMLFPNLVPSSPAANAAIYLGLRGPVLSVADLGLSGEMAVQTAIELLAADEADALCAAAHAELSLLTERVFDPLLLGSSAWTSVRAEGGTSLLLEREGFARARGARVLARVVAHAQGREQVPPSLPAPGAGRTLVVLPRDRADLRAALAAWGWGEARVMEACRVHGDHEASGAQGMALAVAALASGQVDHALVLGWAPGRWAALVLTSAEQAPGQVSGPGR